VGNITEIMLQEKPHVTDKVTIFISKQITSTEIFDSHLYFFFCYKNVTKSEEVIRVGETTEIISQEKFHATDEVKINFCCQVDHYFRNVSLVFCNFYYIIIRT
jgi:hypothetical protein